MNRLAIVTAAVLVMSTCPVAATEPRELRNSAEPAESVLYSFKGGADGSTPLSNLLADGKGDLFGVTLEGGTGCGGGGCGAVFELVRTSRGGYRETVLYRFLGGPTDGEYPSGGLIFGPDGALYGSTGLGGPINHYCKNGCGTVYRIALTPSGAVESIVHLFEGGLADGAQPDGPLVMTTGGTMYGIAQSGAVKKCVGTHCGAVYAIVTASSGFSERLVYKFSGGTLGGNPGNGLTADAAGNLYGTAGGGLKVCPVGVHACGMIYKLVNSSSGFTEDPIYRFRHGVNYPNGPLTVGTDGTVYGAASGGGSTGCGYHGYGDCGALFVLSPRNNRYEERDFDVFSGGAGGGPNGGIVVGADGALYGTTAADGPVPSSFGTAYKAIPTASGYSITVLHAFVGGSDGLLPNGPLIMTDHELYGVTYGGGVNQNGTVYRLSP
jgi:uncharacterized repeat protein (TIGR03803 family)